MKPSDCTGLHPFACDCKSRINYDPMEDPRANVSDILRDLHDLPHEIADLANHASDEMTTRVWCEIMDLAAMLHDLDIQSTIELENVLGAKFNGKKWKFDTWTTRRSGEKTYNNPKKISDRKLAVAATKRKNKDVSE